MHARRGNLSGQDTSLLFNVPYHAYLFHFFSIEYTFSLPLFLMRDRKLLNIELGRVKASDYGNLPESGVVFYRIENKDGLQGILKRLEFSEIESINFESSCSDSSFRMIFLAILSIQFWIVPAWTPMS